jgi:hypothetical protein
MTISKDVIPSGARNLLSKIKKEADSSADAPEEVPSGDGLGMTIHCEMGS